MTTKILNNHPLWITIPWLVMYVTCFYLFYKADPGRWKSHAIPYISGMLGEAKDDHQQAVLRNIAWLVAILITVVPRVLAFHSVRQTGRILLWMGCYYTVWTLTVLSAGWDAHPDTNPFKKWLPGSEIHFILSLVFFVTGGAETFRLFVVRIFPKKNVQRSIVVGMAVYIAVTLTLTLTLTFYLNKKIPGLSWMGHALIPCFEHVMLFAHVGTDSYGVTLVCEYDTLPEIWHESLLTHVSYECVVAQHPLPLQSSGARNAKLLSGRDSKHAA